MNPAPRRSAFALAEFDPVIARAVATWVNEISTPTPAAGEASNAPSIPAPKILDNSND
jgi:hypothetical protein